MSSEKIIRAWKDTEYRESLSAEQRSQIPDNPIGLSEITEAELEAAAGGALSWNDGTRFSITCGFLCSAEWCN